MLHRLSFAPFLDAAAETWFADLGDALEAGGVNGLLLANLAVSEALTLPAVAVLPGRVVVLQPAAAGPNEAAVFAQQAALAAWLGTWPELPPVPAQGIVGFAILVSERESSVATGWPASTLATLPQQLRELPAPLPLPAATLESWATSLTDDDEQSAYYPTSFWQQQARRLWHWLGAADVPADPPYGTVLPAPDTAAEQQRLEQLRAQVFEELDQQRRQLEARETAREQRITQLQQQLSATPSAAAEVAALQARLATETQEKNALAAAIAASRQEAEARNRELETRMQQLGQQVAQLQTHPATAAPAAPATAPLAAVPTTGTMAVPATVSAPQAQSARQRPATGSPAASRPAPPNWRPQWPRVALVLGLLAGIGAGRWAVQHYARPPARTADNRPARQDEADTDEFDENTEAAAPTLFDIQPDTIRVDAEEADSVSETPPAVPRPGEVMDSVEEPAGDI